MDTGKALSQCFSVLSKTPDAWKVVKYLSPKETVVVARRRFAGRRRPHEYLVVSIGPPNYESREFIKTCKAAGEPFPVKRVQIKRMPKRRK